MKSKKKYEKKKSEIESRRGSDTALLWLWRKPVATAPIQPLAWEPPYAEGAAPEKGKKTKEKKKEKSYFWSSHWGSVINESN